MQTSIRRIRFLRYNGLAGYLVFVSAVALALWAWNVNQHRAIKEVEYKNCMALKQETASIHAFYSSVIDMYAKRKGTSEERSSDAVLSAAIRKALTKLPHSVCAPP